MVVVWPASVGSLAHVVAQLGADVSEERAGSLCAALSGLSEALWDTYVRRASATEDEQERSRREHEREQFDDVVEALRVLHRLAGAALIAAMVA
jgi:hypothetical protein